MKTDKEQTNPEIVTADRFQWSDLIRKEDWQAIWGAFLLIAVVAVGVVGGFYDFSGAKFDTWGTETNPYVWDVITAKQSGKWLATGVAFTLIFTIGNWLQQKKVGAFLRAFAALYLLTTVVRLISAQVLFNRYLEYAFWALLLGLVISNLFHTPSWLKPALQTEFYIKTGLIIMGAEVLFSNIAKFGLYGLGIAWGVTPIVIIFMWLLGTKWLKIQDKPLVITIATATSVCGTSAAIAAAAASRARKSDLAFAVGTSLIFTVIMMVGLPLLIQAVGMSPLLGGAWIGGTVDSTGAVVLAGQALGDLGGVVAALVKMIQNILIGFIAFGIALFFTTRVDRRQGDTVGIGEIWQRFPKFILGFVGASLIFSFVLQPTLGTETTTDIVKHLGQFKNWAFALAFTSIGLETHFGSLREQLQGGKPVTLYIIGQLFNLLLTLLVAWLLLSGVLFPIPTIEI
ncbi:MAG: YeiH family protein [Parabacteroides sp.]